MTKRLAWVLLAAALLGSSALWAYHAWSRPRPLLFSGTIEARDAQVGSLVGGRVAAVHVDEGSVVTRGEALVSLEPDLLSLQIKEQQGKVAQARAQLALVLAGPRPEETARARADWQNAEAERRRLEALWREQFVSQQDYDNAAATARIKLETLRQDERGSRPEDIASARAALAQEESQLAYLERQLKETVVTAPADGIVQSMDLRPGDLVAANQPIITLIESDQIWVRIYVPEPMLGLVRVGEKAAIKVDTFPGRTFPGTVAEIRQQGEYTPRNIQTVEQRTDLVFGVKVTIEPAKELKPGMAALVTLQR